MIRDSLVAEDEGAGEGRGRDFLIGERERGDFRGRDLVTLEVGVTRP